jgi:malonate transporter and related proteins
LSALLDVILPVFLIIGFGYAAAKRGIFGESAVDGVMNYAQNFAVPCLLFRSIAGLDLGSAFNPALMLSFYIAAFASFTVGMTGALVVFKRPLTDAVAIGFACLFSNSLLLGLPITERAFGPGALVGNYAIISIHAPLFYAFGIAMMEGARARGYGVSPGALGLKIGRAIGTQPLVIGIALGFVVNLAGFGLYAPLSAAVAMIAATAIPTALFGLGGVLVRYRTEGDRATIAMICGCSLLLHPGLTWLLGQHVFELDRDGMRSAVVTAAMAPGVNAYMFAHIFGVAKRVNASAVLVATALSIVSVWGWLQILP